MSPVAAWYQESVTPLGGGAAINGGTNDLFRTASGAGRAENTEFRAGVITDKAGVLYIEASIDTATWYRVEEEATALINGIHVVGIEHHAIWRYVRARYVNGPSAQTFFIFTTVEL
jgi:hypothetical protein